MKAELARQAANEHNRWAAKNRYEEIIADIMTACTSGKYFIEVGGYPDYISDACREMLEDDGFTMVSSQNGTNRHTISWFPPTQPTHQNRTQ